MSLPRGFAAVCTGDPAAVPLTMKTGIGEPRLVYVFAASQPVRYLGCLVSRFVPGDTQDVSLGNDIPPGPDARGVAHYGTVKLRSMTNVRQRPRTREMLDRATDIISFYAGLLHDAPYPSFTLGVVESELPGGHSPAYFAALQIRHCRATGSDGVTIQPRSRTTRSSSSRTRWRTSGGDTASDGATITSSG